MSAASARSIAQGTLLAHSSGPKRLTIVMSAPCHARDALAGIEQPADVKPASACPVAGIPEQPDLLADMKKRCWEAAIETAIADLGQSNR